jgi:hypothetical protein
MQKRLQILVIIGGANGACSVVLLRLRARFPGATNSILRVLPRRTAALY